jgi:ribonuclease R
MNEMPDLPERILKTLARPSYTPVKPKVLAKKVGLETEEYPEFRKALKKLIHEGRAELGRSNTVRALNPLGTIVGVYRRTSNGLGFVRPVLKPGEAPQPDIRIRDGRELDASTGDTVRVKLLRKSTRHGDASGEVLSIVERATRSFVGTYFERDGEAYVRVDGTVFAHSVLVGDPGAKGAQPQDKVVIDMIRFPTQDARGEGVITEVLGKLHEPGVDLLTIIRGFGLPEEFPEAALAEARAQADAFREDDLDGREDFTQDLVVTIDPVDARDFDDAVSVEIDPKSGHWILTVHIADVAHFVKPGGALDLEARKRATSVYLPRKVIPMFPEVISNGLASLQAGKLRYVKTVQIEWTPNLQKAHVRFANGAIRVQHRFAYEQIQEQLNELGPEPAHDQPGFPNMLRRMRDLAVLLHKKRLKRGSLELSMPEAVLEYDDLGRVSGAHFAVHDLSHKIVEEFMLAANEAVAEHFSRLEVPFLRRVHPAPNEDKLKEFAAFAELLGYPMRRAQDRFELQRLLVETAEKPERAAIHYALLRSLKQAWYSPIQDEHYALASQDYCHFTSPIRRYPDLQVHRLLDRWIRHKKATADVKELEMLGDHCSKMERRAETAERELVKLKLLQYLSTRLGEQLDAVITGVAEYGFFAQAERFPAEGLVHISSLTDDFYLYEEDSRQLYGRRTKQRYRLGDRVRVEVARVEVQKRMLDFRLVTGKPRETSAPGKLSEATPVSKPPRPLKDKKKLPPLSKKHKRKKKG